ncbi:MAG: hypothetical protein MUP41_15740 [Desulfobacterales bacterium]|nr:hypothetical protein [Desulfobacterales bacterium]
MIEIHHHLLHGLGDGPSSIKESIQMRHIGFRDGIPRGGHHLSWGWSTL